MTRWTDEVGSASGDAYERRLDDLARSGRSMHGEADFVTSLVQGEGRVLDAGCGTGRVGIELGRRGLEVVGVDADDSMLAVARHQDPDGGWILADLARLEQADPRLGGAFDLVLLAGNVVPLLAVGTEGEVVSRLAGCLRPGAWLVAGFGLDVGHLPLSEVPVSLAEYDDWCRQAGLLAHERFATWDREPFVEPAGYVVRVHVASPTVG